MKANMIQKICSFLGQYSTGKSLKLTGHYHAGSYFCCIHNMAEINECAVLNSSRGSKFCQSFPSFWEVVMCILNSF